MRRKLFNLASALSLLVCVVTLVLWMRSRSYRDVVIKDPYNPSRRVYSQRSVNSAVGRIWINSVDLGITEDWLAKRMTDDRSRGGYADEWSYHQWSAADVDLRFDGFWHRAGFDCSTWRGVPTAEGPSDGWNIQIPHWFLIVVTVLLPLVAVVRFLRARRRADRGMCPGCGYDLRATPDRCPECGTPVAKKDVEIKHGS